MYTDPEKESSKIPFLTNDLGGFDMGKINQRDEELYIRWLEFSMFCPVMEDFSQPENPTSNLAWKYSERADTIFRFYAHLRMQLFPYLYTAAYQSRLKGINMIRKIPGHLYEYMLGDELLIAPVHEKGATSEIIYLPEGTWINYRTGEKYSGETNQLVSSPIDQIPVFVRQGSIIPMRKYASSIEKGNNDTLSLHIYPGEDATYTLFEDDGTSNDYLRGIYAATKIEFLQSGSKLTVVLDPVEGTYIGMNDYRNWRLIIHHIDNPSQVLVKNHKVMEYYDKSLKNLIIGLYSSKKEKIILKIN